ncbi:hypothetical protein ACFQXA_18780 [Nocardiopsis composta]
MAAILPAVYGIKEIAKDGPGAVPLLALAAGAVLGWVFVRRQRRLTDPCSICGSSPRASSAPRWGRRPPGCSRWAPSPSSPCSTCRW